MPSINGDTTSTQGISITTPQGNVQSNCSGRFLYLGKLKSEVYLISSSRMIATKFPEMKLDVQICVEDTYGLHFSVRPMDDSLSSCYTKYQNFMKCNFYQSVMLNSHA